MYKEIPFFFFFFFYRGDKRQKSKTGSVGDEAQCSTVLCCFFFLIFPYLLAQKQVKCFKYSVHDSNITSVSLYDKGRTTTGVGNKLIRGYRAAVSPKHLKAGTPREKCLYLLALNVEILP